MINKIGNYNPYINVTNNLSKITKPEETSTNKVTKEEKAFFSNMYPENKVEIMDYHFYEKSGSMSGISKGSLFDKRG